MHKILVIMELTWVNTLYNGNVVQNKNYMLNIFHAMNLN
jgi:hypothetical protein